MSSSLGSSDQERLDDELVEVLVEALDAFRHWCPCDVTQPVHEKEACLSVGVPVAKEVAVHWLQDGVQGHELAESDANAPHIKPWLCDDLGLGLVGQEPSPLRRAVARGEGDGGVVDGDLAVDGHASVHIDKLQAPVEHHQVLRLQVQMHEALGVKPGDDQKDGTGTGLDRLPGQRLVLPWLLWSPSQLHYNLLYIPRQHCEIHGYA